MLVEYLTFENGQKTHQVEIEVDREIDDDTREGIEYINRKISEAANIPLGSFKYTKPL